MTACAFRKSGGRFRRSTGASGTAQRITADYGRLATGCAIMAIYIRYQLQASIDGGWQG
jgi:hypothetical protein